MIFSAVRLGEGLKGKYGTTSALTEAPYKKKLCVKIIKYHCMSVIASGVITASLQTQSHILWAKQFNK